jgi:arylsulfatase A-like enzyme
MRFADHGEQALSHGLVEKFYNAYEESIHIPLIISNPKVYKAPVTNDSLVTLLDLVPTVADLLGLQDEFQDNFYGKSLVPILNDPTTAASDEKEVVHFTYNDIACRGAPSIIRCIRTREYKYAVYFTADGSDADWELYNLMMDSDENINLAGQTEYASIQFVLDETLQTLMRDYKTQPAFDWPPKQTNDSRGGSPQSK